MLKKRTSLTFCEAVKSESIVAHVDSHNPWKKVEIKALGKPSLTG
jgi:hypothetical protein